MTISLKGGGRTSSLSTGTINVTWKVEVAVGDGARLAVGEEEPLSVESLHRSFSDDPMDSDERGGCIGANNTFNSSTARRGSIV